MQITVFTDELNDKLFNDPDKTFVVHLLLTLRKAAPFLAFLLFYGSIGDILLIAFWGVLLYNTERGYTAFKIFYKYYCFFIEIVSILMIPAAWIEETLFKIPEMRRLRRSSSNSLDGDIAKTEGLALEPGKQKVMNQKMFITYENERWWLGLGFCTKFFTKDRSNWSDDLGQITLYRDGFKLPGPNWKWGSSWHYIVDSHTDKKGWEYAGSFEDFNKPKSSKSVLKIVRRRKWIRRCMEIEV